jgi:competence protein ComEC
LSARGLWIALLVWIAGLTVSAALGSDYQVHLIAGPIALATLAALIVGVKLLPPLSLLRRLTGMAGRRSSWSGLLFVPLFLLAVQLGGGRLSLPPATGGHLLKQAGQGLLNPGYRPLLWTPSDRPANRPEEDERLRVPEWSSEPLWRLSLGVLLNRRDLVPPDWLQAFRLTGAAHLLAVSGLHIGILFGILLGLLRMARVPRRLTAVLASMGLALYVVAIGAPPSALRASAMAAAGLTLWAGGRLSRPERVLPFALLALLIAQPRLLASTGFQLSACAMAGIGIALRGFERRRLLTIRGRASAFLRVSLGAQAGTVPLQIVSFGTLTPLAALTNIVAVPLTGVWLPSVLLALCLNTVPGAPGAIAGWLAEGTGRLLAGWVVLIHRIPGATTPIPAWAGAVAAIGFVSWAAGRRGRIVGLACLAVGAWSPVLAPAGPRVTFLDVGQGDAIVIEAGSPQRIIVVDAGPSFLDWDAGERVIAPYLRRRGIDRIDLLVASHTDGDHIGGMASLVERFPIGSLLRGDRAAARTRSARRLDREIARHRVPVVIGRQGDFIDLGGGCRIEVLLGADPSEEGSGGIIRTNNNRSLVLRMVTPWISVLLTGDLEMTGEDRLWRVEPWLPSRVLKVSHHGSPDATSLRFLSVVEPGLAVLSVGARNRYGHPSPKLLARLTGVGVPYWRTDRKGALVLEPGRRLPGTTGEGSGR